MMNTFYNTTWHKVPIRLSFPFKLKDTKMYLVSINHEIQYNITDCKKKRFLKRKGKPEITPKKKYLIFYTS